MNQDIALSSTRGKGRHGPDVLAIAVEQNAPSSFTRMIDVRNSGSTDSNHASATTGLNHPADHECWQTCAQRHTHA